MALPRWPAGVPYEPLRDSISGDAPFPRPLRSEFEDGNERTRNVSLTSWTPMQFSLVITPLQYDALKTFFSKTIGNQSARFTMPIWNVSDGRFIAKEVRIDDGLPLPKPYGATVLKIDLRLRVKNW